MSNLFTLTIVRTLHALTLVLVCLGGPSFAAESAQTWQFVHNGPESADDHRYDYHWAVLAAALDATRGKYGPYSMKSVNFMTETRQVYELQQTSGLINTMVLDSTAELEASLLPVKVPVDKGLLGYRVFLIQAQAQKNFDKVQTLADLRKFSIGQGSDWSDVAIFKSAGFDVVGAVVYESLFEMLMANRFDAFGRGVTEVVDELNERKQKYPGMAIEKNVLLYYPMPIYFWFPKNATGTRYAQRVDEGMRIISSNGTLDRMFKKQYGSLIRDLRLKDRKLFRIPNPNLPVNQPFANKSLWFDPLR